MLILNPPVVFTAKIVFSQYQRFKQSLDWWKIHKQTTIFFFGQHKSVHLFRLIEIFNAKWTQIIWILSSWSHINFWPYINLYSLFSKTKNLKNVRPQATPRRLRILLWWSCDVEAESAVFDNHLFALLRNKQTNIKSSDFF